MPPTSARTSFLLRLLQLRIYNEMVEALRPFDLTPFQYMALSVVGHRSDSSTADMARRFRIAPQSMNEVVAALEAKRLIVRRELPAHRRILQVSLTSAGMRLLEKCDREIDGVEAAAFQALSPSELSSFRRALDKALTGAPRIDRAVNS